MFHYIFALLVSEYINENENIDCSSYLGMMAFLLQKLCCRPILSSRSPSPLRNPKSSSANRIFVHTVHYSSILRWEWINSIVTLAIESNRIERWNDDGHVSSSSPSLFSTGLDLRNYTSRLCLWWRQHRRQSNSSSRIVDIVRRPLSRASFLAKQITYCLLE